ncbi:hypothetical protein ACIQZN_34140 [Streptomyces sp. NPDC097595]|uniref:hypothetical protein n=1 Tax=Streptomyces sp. NPDC097595 TaxID=3366090 RepID=UPI00382F4BDD
MLIPIEAVDGTALIEVVRLSGLPGSEQHRSVLSSGPDPSVTLPSGRPVADRPRGSARHETGSHKFYVRSSE